VPVLGLGSASDAAAETAGQEWRGDRKDKRHEKQGNRQEKREDRRQWRSSYAAPWAPALAGLFASSLGSLTVHFFGKDSRENPDELVSSPGHMAPAAASDRAADRDAMTVEELCRGEPRALLTASLSRALSRGAQACR
jgi:hypothetical protein